MARFSAPQSVATARILLQIIRHVLDSVVLESEDAVTKITEALNNMSELSDAQRRNLSAALEDFYHDSQAEGFKQELNLKATEIMEAAAEGDFARVDAIGNSSEYQSQKQRTKRLHDHLQELIESSSAMSETIFPLLISLQFQDKMKQELVGLTRALELFLSRDTISVEVELDFDEFWEKIHKGFNVVETRNAVLSIVQSGLNGKAS